MTDNNNLNHQGSLMIASHDQQREIHFTKVAVGLRDLFDRLPETMRQLSDDLPNYYAVPAWHRDLISWLRRLGFESERDPRAWSRQVDQYWIVDAPESVGNQPQFIRSRRNAVLTDYRLFPTNQESGHLLAVILEPNSEFGLHEFPQFSVQLIEGSRYPILRVDRL